MECVRNDLGEPDASGRRRPIPVAGSEFTVKVDTVVLALGYASDRAAVDAAGGVEADVAGRIVIDPATGATRREGVFAGGDAVSGPSLVVTAVAQARRAAEAMHRHMTSTTVGTGRRPR
jgi:glutamate synthase (NADPH/NADH) small chain